MIVILAFRKLKETEAEEDSWYEPEKQKLLIRLFIVT